MQCAQQLHTPCPYCLDMPPQCWTTIDLHRQLVWFDAQCCCSKISPAGTPRLSMPPWPTALQAPVLCHSCLPHMLPQWQARACHASATGLCSSVRQYVAGPVGAMACTGNWQGQPLHGSIVSLRQANAVECHDMWPYGPWWWLDSGGPGSMQLMQRLQQDKASRTIISPPSQLSPSMLHCLAYLCAM